MTHIKVRVGIVKLKNSLSRLLRIFWVQSILAVFFGGVLYWWIVQIMGGFNSGDAESTLYSSVMMSHGYWSCTYRGFPSSYTVSGPIYLMASALAQWITRAGFSSSLTASSLGSHCQYSFNAYVQWSSNPSAYYAALRTGIVAWFALCVSGVGLLRCSNLPRNRSVWLLAITFAVTPPLIFCVQEYYHPQDVWALAMLFAATSLWLRHRMYGAGFFLALAVMSQPYALLGLIVLLAISPWVACRKLAVGGMVTTIVTVTMMVVISGPRALTASLIGTGDTTIHIGTWMWELHISSVYGLLLSRLAPLAAAIAISRWCYRRRPDIADDPVLLLSLMATCLSLRLVFEENLWSYYCMATGVTLVLRDIVAARVSRGTIYWLVLVLAIFVDVDSTLLPWSGWHTWVWQILLAPSAFFVSFLSLRKAMRSRTMAIATKLKLKGNSGVGN